MEQLNYIQVNEELLHIDLYWSILTQDTYGLLFLDFRRKVHVMSWLDNVGYFLFSQRSSFE